MNLKSQRFLHSSPNLVYYRRADGSSARYLLVRGRGGRREDGERTRVRTRDLVRNNRTSLLPFASCVWYIPQPRVIVLMYVRKRWERGQQQ